MRAIQVKLWTILIACLPTGSANPAWGEEAASASSDIEFKRAVSVFGQCFGERTALAAKSDMSDSAAADFAIDACRKELADSNYWRCHSNLDGSNPIFAVIFADASNPLETCQKVFNERDVESLRVEALTQVMRARYE